MSEETPVQTAPLTRDEIRARVLDTAKTVKSKLVEVFGTTIEMRQPSLRDIMKARETEDTESLAAQMIVKYAVVPNTTEKVFTEEDIQTILDWPFGEDLQRVNEAISELTGIDIEEVETKLEQDPLD